MRFPLVVSSFCCNFAKKKMIRNMKNIIVLMTVALMACATAVAKDLKVLVVKTTPAVQNVEAQTKVKDLLRLTAGVKKVVADFSAQQVSVTYDADKTNAKKILASLKKNGYEATVVSDGAPKENAKGQGAVDGVSGASPQKK